MLNNINIAQANFHSGFNFVLLTLNFVLRNDSTSSLEGVIS